MKLAALRQQTWAITRDALRALEARGEAMGDLIARGLTVTQPLAEASPAETARIAYNGGNPIVPEIVGGIATIEIMGDLIARAPWWAKAYLGAIDPYDLADAIDALAADGTVTALVLEVDCCGGTVNGTAEARAALDRFQAAGKTLTARAAGVLASAAYWLVAGADHIEATATTVVGSLGVFQVLVDQSAALSAMGVKLEVVATGPLKGAGADGTVTPAVRDAAQRIVEALNGVFRDAVAAGRGFTVAQLDATFTGDVWIGAAAHAAGLIDAVATFAESPEQPDGDTPPPTPKPPALDSTDDPSPSASAPVTTTALAASPKDNTMDPKLQAALAALSTQHPTFAAALVGEAIKTGATPDSLASFASAQVAKASADAIAAELVKAKSDLAAAQASAATAKTAADVALAAMETRAKAAETRVEAIRAHAPTYVEPGADGVEKTPEQVAAMSPAAKAKHYAAIEAAKAAQAAK